MTKYFLICSLFAAVALLPLLSCNSKSDKESSANSSEWLDTTAVSTSNKKASAETAKSTEPEDNRSETADAKASAADNLPTVIDFYATWCGPCKQIAPVFDQLKVQYDGRVKFVSIDIDADEAMARQYGIEAVPTFVLLDKNGKEVDRVIGADVESLRNAVRKISQQ